MEIGDILFEQLKSKIQRGDLDVKVSAGLIMSAPLGTLTVIRDALHKQLKRGLIYFTISGQPLYLVHWNDLCEKKRMEIEGGRIKHDR